MVVTLGELASLVQGELLGDPSLPVHGAAPISEIQPQQITFLEDEKYLPLFLNSEAVAAIIPKKWKPLQKNCIRVNDPLMSFIQIFQHFHPRRSQSQVGIHPTATIDPTAEIAADAWVGPHVTIGAGTKIGPGCRLFAGVSVGADCQLGEQVILHPNVVLYDETRIGNRVMIHANAVIGADGFGYRFQQGQHVKIPQLGCVEIGDDVEIGACTTIDRAAFGVTRIGSGTKLDNLVMIGHNCRIGKHNMIVSQVGIAGSVTTGDYVVMAGQVGIADHLKIGDRATLGAKCGVHKDVPADEKLHGIPGRPAKEQLRIMMSLEKLGEMRKDLRRIKELLGLKDETLAESA